MVSLADNYTQSVEDEPYDITCCYNTTHTSVPIIIQWYQDMEKIEYTNNLNLQVTIENSCSTLHIASVSLEDDGRTYKCRAETDSPLLYTMRTTLNMAEVTLNVNERIIGMFTLLS